MGSECCPLSPLYRQDTFCANRLRPRTFALPPRRRARADVRMRMGAFITAKTASLLVPRQEWRL